MPQSRFLDFRAGSARSSVVGLNGVEVQLPETAPTDIKIQYSEQESGRLTFVPSPDAQQNPHSLIYEIPPDQTIEDFSVRGAGLKFEAPSDHSFDTLSVAITGGNSNMGNVHSRTVSLASMGGETDASGLRCKTLSVASNGGVFHAPEADNTTLHNSGSQLFAAVPDSPTARFSLVNTGGTARVHVPYKFDGNCSSLAMGGAVFANGEMLPQSFQRPPTGNM
jgi:hypothetical protein